MPGQPMLEPLKGLSPGSTASFFGQRLLLSPSVADAVPSVPASLQSSHQACSSTFCIEATDHSVGGGASVPSAQVPDARSFPNGPLGAEPQPAQLLGEGDEDSSIALKRTKVLWAKALWWATQEARRRKAQQIADQQQLERGKAKTGVRLRSTISMVQWLLSQKIGNAIVPLEEEPGGEGGPAGVNRTGSGDEASFSGTGTMRAVSGDGWAVWASRRFSDPGPETLSARPRNSPSRRSLPRLSIDAGASFSWPSGSEAEFAGTPGEQKGSLFPPAPPKTVQGHVTRLLGSRGYIYGTILCTLWVIGGDDVYILQNPPVSLDQSVYCLYVVCGALFMLDLLLRVKWEVRYRLGFYFWLDVIAIISLLPEVIWVIASHDIFASEGEQTSSVARSGRVASAAARVSRILRIMKLLKQVYELKKKSIRNVANDIGDNSALELARKLENYVTIHVMIAVFAMLVLSVALTVAYACTQETLLEYFALPLYVRPLAECMGKPEEARPMALYSLDCIERWKHEYLKDMQQRFAFKLHPQPLIFLSVSNVTMFGSPDTILQYRQKPRSYLVLVLQDLGAGNGAGVVHLDRTADVQNESWTNLATVLSVLSVIIFLSVTLTSSMRIEIIGPMERIVKIIESLVHDPLGRANEPGGGADDKVDNGCWKLTGACTNAQEKQAVQEKHVYAVERAILRVRNLLQLGLGEAGAQIISANMRDGGMVLNQSGKLVHAIFGFCDIRNFTDCTEVLQADIVKLVNGVARHVHMCTADSYGAPNKNIGDAFLLVWKPKGDMSISDVADSSLRSYVRVIIEMQMCDALRRLERRSALQQRMPGFQVRLGFGLHYGWAVEGAIGSKLKIDVSYLSPHVNMASRLEAATKQYGTAILLSDSIYLLMSPATRSRCRLVDRITVKGSKQPVSLYTYDVPDIQSRGGLLPDNTVLASPSLSTEDFFSTVVPPSTSSDFRKLHRNALELYLGGPDGSRSDWLEAATVLRKCLKLRPEDGPSLAILHAMESLAQEDGRAPGDWPGFRPLTEK